MSKTNNDWTKPQPVDGITLAFPANVIGTLLPLMAEIPDEFKRYGNRWAKQATTWFFSGVDKTKSKIKPKEGVDASVAFRHLGACLGSFEPKHEHKEAGVAYLMSLWFDELELVGAK